MARLGLQRQYLSSAPHQHEPLCTAGRDRPCITHGHASGACKRGEERHASWLPLDCPT
jgi:hypothetical protein